MVDRFTLLPGSLEVRCFQASIQAGEEITISYTQSKDTTTERRKELKNNYLFDCHCVRCEEDEVSYAQMVKEIDAMSDKLDELVEVFDTKEAPKDEEESNRGQQVARDYYLTLLPEN
jgi:hypothetical protein